MLQPRYLWLRSGATDIKVLEWDKTMRDAATNQTTRFYLSKLSTIGSICDGYPCDGKEIASSPDLRSLHYRTAGQIIPVARRSRTSRNRRSARRKRADFRPASQKLNMLKQGPEPLNREQTAANNCCPQRLFQLGPTSLQDFVYAQFMLWTSGWLLDSTRPRLASLSSRNIKTASKLTTTTSNA